MTPRVSPAASADPFGPHEAEPPSPGPQQFGRHFAQFFLARVAIALGTVASVPVFTRLVRPDDFGVYVLVVSAVTVLATATVGWVASALLRFHSTASTPGSYGTFLRTALGAAGYSWVASMLLAVVALLIWRTPLAAAGAGTLVVPGLTLLALTAWNQVLLSAIRARGAMGLYSMLNVLQIVGGLLAATIAVVVLDFGPSGLLWGPVASNVLVLGALLRTLGAERHQMVTGRFDRLLAREFARYGYPAAAIGIFTWVSSASDRYVIGALRGSAEVGIYSASYSIAEQSLFALSSLFSVTAVPILFRLWEHEGPEPTRAFTATIARYFVLIAVPAAVGISALAEPLMRMLVDREYLAGYRIVPYVAVGALLVGIANLYSEGLTYHRRTDLLLGCYVAAGVLNIGLNLATVGRFGLFAAGLNKAIAYAGLLLAIIWLSRRFFQWSFPVATLARTLGASAGMGVVMVMMGSFGWSSFVHLAAAAVAGTLAYAVGLFALGEVTASEAARWGARLVRR